MVKFLIIFCINVDIDIIEICNMECSDPNKIEKGTSSKSKRKRKSEMEEGSSSKSKRKRTSEIEEAKAGPRILLGTCGSTANRNFGHVCTQFKKWGETKAVITDATYRFPYETFPNGVTVYSDRQQWDKWKNRGDSVLHVELCEWADLMVIAPITANSLAKVIILFLSTLSCDTIPITNTV